MPGLRTWLRGGVLVCGLCGVLSAQAEDYPVLGISPWRIAGYGTLGHTWDDSSDFAMLRDISQRPTDSYRTKSSWRIDSRIGVQVAYRPAAHWEGVVQTVLRDQVADDLSSMVELAYLNWMPTPEFSVQFGRTGYHPFLMSDHRNLGYAYAWVRPPTEFYGWLPNFSVDGVDLSLALPRQQADWRVHLQAGRSQTDLPMGNDGTFHFETHDLWSVALSRQSGPWRVKAGWSTFSFAEEAEPLLPLQTGLDQIAAAGVPGISNEAAALRQDLSFADERVHYFTLGVAYDDGDWIGQAEIGYTATSAAIVPASRTAYIAIGRRLGDFTPYAMYSISQPELSLQGPVYNWDDIGQGELQDAAYVVANSTRIDQRTFALGVRWDIDARAALKLQWDQVSIDRWGYALWFRNPVRQSQASDVNIFTLNLDVLF